MYKLWNTLNDLKQYRWVELSHSLNNTSPYWAGIPEGSVELSKTVFDWGNPMLECLIQTFKFPGQFGTHIDFPGHFVKGAPLSESYGLSHTMKGSQLRAQTISIYWFRKPFRKPGKPSWIF